MAANLRVEGLRAYQPHREVEPVPPYPRINSQQPRDEYPHQNGEQRADRDEHARRRFRAMRTFIDKLKKDQSIARVDHLTAEKELNALGLEIAENELARQLLELKLSVEGVEEIFLQIRERSAAPDLQVGEPLLEDDLLFPVFVAGLSTYHLCFLNLQLLSTHKSSALTKGIETEGRFVAEQNRVRFDFRPLAGIAGAGGLEMDIRLRVAISEVDDAGRRVILYRRSDRSFALYADKQINISI